MAQNWARETIANAVEEVRSYHSTASAFARHPGLFMSEWAAGERRAMNPLGFFASSLAIVGTLGQLDRLWPAPGEPAPSFVRDALEAMGPYLHAVLLALLVHAVLRARGSRRSALDSIAAALYAGGIAVVTATFALEAAQASFRKPILEVVQTAAGLAWIAIGICGPTVFLVIALVAALASLHGMPRRLPAVAFALSWIATGLLLSWLDPPGRYGLHLSLAAKDGESIKLGIGF
jgi:hypothetical protein